MSGKDTRVSTSADIRKTSRHSGAKDRTIQARMPVKISPYAITHTSLASSKGIRVRRLKTGRTVGG